MMRSLAYWALAVLAISILAGCTGDSGAPETPPVEAGNPERVAEEQSTAVARPASTPPPSYTPTLMPTSVPTATPSPMSTATAAPTLTPTPAPTPTPTPIPSPTATPAPGPTATPSPMSTATAAPSRAYAAPHSCADAAPTLTPTPTPTPIPSPTATPAPEPTATHSAVQRLEAEYPILAEKIQRRAWYRDGVSEAESGAIEWLYRLSTYEEEETAAALVSMPFLNSVEHDDVLALRAMTYPAFQAATYGARRGLLAAIINHPALRDGISDDQTTLVVAASTLRDADEIKRMLSPGYADIEIFAKGTELTPSLKISIVRTGTPRQAHTAPALWNGLEFSERKLQVPLPVNHVIVVVNHSATFGGGGSHYGFAIGYNPEFGKDGDDYITRLHYVHETSHSFWIHAGHVD